MENLNVLYAYKEKYEKEKLFVEAKLAVVEEMIADEKAKHVVLNRETVVEDLPKEAAVECSSLPNCVG